MRVQLLYKVWEKGTPKVPRPILGRSNTLLVSYEVTIQTHTHTRTHAHYMHTGMGALSTTVCVWVYVCVERETV